MLNTPQEIYDLYQKNIEHDMNEYSPLLREMAKGNILEIGVRGAVSTAAFLLGIQKNGGWLCSVDVVKKCYETFSGHKDWLFVHGDSHDGHIVDLIKLLGPYDIVFIDGDHSRDGVRADLHNFGPLVKKGGMLLAHDVDITVPPEHEPDWPTIAVREEFDSYVYERCWTSHIVPGKFGLGIAVNK
jgi:predicted O-methyltransferase YrrM